MKNMNERYANVRKDVLAAIESGKHEELATAVSNFTKFMEELWKTDDFYGFDTLGYYEAMDEEIPEDEISLPNFTETQLKNRLEVTALYNEVFMDILLGTKTSKTLAVVLIMANFMGTEMLPVIKFWMGDSVLGRAAQHMIYDTPRAFAIGVLMKKYYEGQGTTALNVSKGIAKEKDIMDKIAPTKSRRDIVRGILGSNVPY